MTALQESMERDYEGSISGGFLNRYSSFNPVSRFKRPLERQDNRRKSMVTTEAGCNAEVVFEYQRSLELLDSITIVDERGN